VKIGVASVVSASLTIFFYCASVSNGPHRAIGPPSALLTFLISHFRILNHSHFNGLFRVVQQLLVRE
jgi:hypothetical protein